MRWLVLRIRLKIFFDPIDMRRLLCREYVTVYICNIIIVLNDLRNQSEVDDTRNPVMTMADLYAIYPIFFFPFFHLKKKQGMENIEIREMKD